MPRRRDIEEDEVGSRSFGVQCSRDVEAAVAHLRHGLGGDWSLLLPEETKALEWILREAWAVIGSRGWGRIGFSFATLEQVEEIAALGEKAQAGKIVRLAAAREVKRILAGLPPPGEPVPVSTHERILPK
ncbi:MAG: hypothetical protein ACM3UP_01065 [Methanocella sp.]